MNTTKKSAVGAATPATETEKENLYTDIISSDGGKIKRKKEVYKSRVVGLSMMCYTFFK